MNRNRTALAVSLLIGTIYLPASEVFAALQVSVIDLHPANATSSSANGVSTNQQAGVIHIGGVDHAVVWSGSPDSYIDLHPAGADSSSATATIGSQQVGTARVGGVSHAATWYGTPDTFADLNPAGARNSTAAALNSTAQGGSAVFTTRMAGMWWGADWSFYNFNVPSRISGMSESQQIGDMAVGLGLHAALWSGSPDTVVDLNPAGASASRGYAVLGDQQVGEVQYSGISHATVWNSTSDSAVDLHPAGATWSVAYGLIQGYQAGYARFGGYDHAALWSGTAGSFLDLHSFLDSNFTNSWGKGISGDLTGAIIVAGFATQSSDGQSHAMLWTIRAVANPPVLAVLNATKTSDGTVLTLGWTDDGGSYLLQGSPSLGGSWQTVTGPWTTNGSTVMANITNVSPAQFYRLSAN